MVQICWVSLSELISFIMCLSSGSLCCSWENRNFSSSDIIGIVLFVVATAVRLGVRLEIREIQSALELTQPGL